MQVALKLVDGSIVEGEYDGTVDSLMFRVDNKYSVIQLTDWHQVDLSGTHVSCISEHVDGRPVNVPGRKIVWWA